LNSTIGPNGFCFLLSFGWPAIYFMSPNRFSSYLRIGYLFLSVFFGGMITGWVAIGEGELVSALLMLVYQFSSAVSIAVGVVLLAVNSIYLA
jgi:hypothetical protein